MQMNMLSGTWTKDRFAFGGDLLRGSHAKKKRCFRAQLPLHVVMKSSQARGEKSLFRHNAAITALVQDQAKRHGVKIYAGANAGNHLHLLMGAPARDCLVRFLKALSGRISQLVQVSWDARPFSRIVSWGRDFKNMARYIGMTSTEMTGMSRESVRQMFARIQEAISSGLLPKTPELEAAGFA